MPSKSSLTSFWCSDPFSYSIESRAKITLAYKRFRAQVGHIYSQLNDINKIHSEETLQKCLLEYDSVMGVLDVPIVFFRYSGRIIKATPAFSNLCQVPCKELVEEAMFYDVFCEISVVNLLEKLATLSENPGTRSLITSVNVKVRQSDDSKQPNTSLREVANFSKLVPCSVSAIMKRDTYGVPIVCIATVIPMNHSSSSQKY